MNIVVTGGAGFVGTNFVYYLLEIYGNINNIICIDKLTYAGNIENLRVALEFENVSFYKTDICDKSAMENIFLKENPDIVVNFAAESHVDRSINFPEAFLKTNVLGVQVLMELCLKYGIGRFHQVSTDEVYGELPLNRPELSFVEDSHINPSSPYSASKAAADLLIHAYGRTYGLNATISRCANNYGFYQHSEKLIPLIIEKAKKNEPLPVYGNGSNVRDWIHVNDHCSAIDLIIKNGVSGQIYNVGGYNELNNIELVKLICNIMEKPHSLITYVKDRSGHDLRYAVNSTKIMIELNWKAKIDFLQGLEDTIKWYLG